MVFFIKLASKLPVFNVKILTIRFLDATLMLICVSSELSEDDTLDEYLNCYKYFHQVKLLF